MGAKDKTNYGGNGKVTRIKDSFQTPRYATELLEPFIPEHIKTIWECAAGEGRIARVLLNKYLVHCTEVNGNYPYYDFIKGGKLPFTYFTNTTMVVTNPPFSMKKEFYEACVDLELPFALLIPFDMSGWLVKAFMDGAQGIVPSRRIDYITPNILKNIAKKELWKNRPDLFTHVSSIKKVPEKEFDFLIDMFGKEYLYESVDDVPEELLQKHSSSDFHSFWLVGGLNLPQQMTFVDLSIKDKKRIL